MRSGMSRFETDPSSATKSTGTSIICCVLAEIGKAGTFLGQLFLVGRQSIDALLAFIAVFYRTQVAAWLKLVESALDLPCFVSSLVSCHLFDSSLR
jgi:hypothetical protein